MSDRPRSHGGRRPKRYSQAGRILHLIDVLEAYRYGRTHAQLAEELGVSERQVRRDLAVLERIGNISGLRAARGGRRSRGRVDRSGLLRSFRWQEERSVVGGL